MFTKKMMIPLPKKKNVYLEKLLRDTEKFSARRVQWPNCHLSDCHRLKKRKYKSLITTLHIEEILST